MRVLHVVRQFPPAVGGLESFVLSLAKQQRQQGLDARVLTLNTVFHQHPARVLPEQEVMEGVPVRRMAWSGSYRYPIAPSALGLARGHDLIHVHAVDSFADGFALTRPMLRTPMVLSTHGGFFHTGASLAKRLYMATVTRMTLRAYSRVIACSVSDEALFAPLCRDWLTRVDNGVDVEKFADAGSVGFVPRLVFLGRFSDNKRLDLLLTAFAELRRRQPDAELSLIGRDWDDNLAGLQQRIQAPEFGGAVQIMLGLDDAAVRQQLGRHGFLVSASDYEGFGLSLVEGLSAGLLPMVSTIPAFTEILRNAGVGKQVDFHDPQAAGAAMASYLAECQGEYAALRQQAQLAAQPYGWVQTAQRFQAIYEEVLGVHARDIQGVKVDTRGGSAIISALDEAVAQRTPTWVAISNANTINLARTRPAYRELLSRFLVLNDGTGVNLASRWKYGRSFRENLNGTDFVPRLLGDSSRTLKVFLLGARPDVVASAHRRLLERFPRHRWVGYLDGYGGLADADAACREIRAHSPDLLLVAMGNPLQEEWIAKYGHATGAVVAVGVGALFDFLAGKVERAPRWMQRLGAEWLYRLAQEPGRLWRRYLVGNFTFLWAAWRDRA